MRSSECFGVPSRIEEQSRAGLNAAVVMCFMPGAEPRRSRAVAKAASGYHGYSLFSLVARCLLCVCSDVHPNGKPQP